MAKLKDDMEILARSAFKRGIDASTTNAPSDGWAEVGKAMAAELARVTKLAYYEGWADGHTPAEVENVDVDYKVSFAKDNWGSE